MSANPSPLPRSPVPTRHDCLHFHCISAMLQWWQRWDSTTTSSCLRDSTLKNQLQIISNHVPIPDRGTKKTSKSTSPCVFTRQTACWVIYICIQHSTKHTENTNECHYYPPTVISDKWRTSPDKGITSPEVPTCVPKSQNPVKWHFTESFCPSQDHRCWRHHTSLAAQPSNNHDFQG